MIAPRHSLLALAAALAAWPVLPLQAQSLYQHKVSVSAGVEHDSNPGLKAVPVGGVTRWRLSPDYTLLRRDGPDDLTLRLGATFEQSSDTALSRDRRNGNALGEWQHTSEKTIYVLRAGITQAALRDVLLEETGQVSADGTRTTRSVDGTLAHQFDDLHRMSAGVNARWNRYTGDTVPDGRQFGANAEFSRALQPGKDAYVAGSVSHFSSDNRAPGRLGSTSSSMRSISVGARYAAPDDPWSWDVRAGASDYGGPTGNTSVTGAVQLGYAGPRWNAALAFSREPVTDSLSGAFSANQRLRASVEYELTELTRLAFFASRNRTSGLNAAATREIGVRASTELSPVWRLTMQLRRISTSRDTFFLSTRAGATIAGVVLTYTHPDF